MFLRTRLRRWDPLSLTSVVPHRTSSLVCQKTEEGREEQKGPYGVLSTPLPSKTSSTAPSQSEETSQFIRTWNSFVLDSVSRHGNRNNEWMTALELVQDAVYSGCVFSQTQFVSAIRAYDGADCWQHALILNNIMYLEGMGASYNVPSWFQLVRCLRRHGHSCWQHMLELYSPTFRPRIKRGEDDHAALFYTIISLTMARQWEHALRVFDMETSSCVTTSLDENCIRHLLSPTPERNDRTRLYVNFSLAKALHARCAQGLLWQVGLSMLSEMSREANAAVVAPSAISTALSLLELAGEWRRALTLWQTAPGQRDDRATQSVLSVLCSVNSNTPWYLAYIFFSSSLPLSPSSGVVLDKRTAPILEAAKRAGGWKEVARVFSMASFVDTTAWLKLHDVLSSCRGLLSVPYGSLIRLYSSGFERNENVMKGSPSLRLPREVLLVLFRHHAHKAKNLDRAVRVLRHLHYTEDETCELLATIRRDHNALTLSLDVLQFYTTRYNKTAMIPTRLLEVLTLQFSKSNRWSEALRCVDELLNDNKTKKKRVFNHTVFAALHYSYALSAMWEESFTLLKRMRDMDIQPCSVTLRSVAALCVQRGDSAKAHALLMELLKSGIHGQVA
eukprot:PhM_4_TR1763/c0_g1_i1/m.38259